MSKIFTGIKPRSLRKNKFNLSYEHKLSFNPGYCVPFMAQEIIPGDKFRVSSEVFIRMAPMLAPIMHRINLYTHYFFVPNRLNWEEWEDFITGGKDGLSAPLPPTIEINTTHVQAGLFAKGKINDYLGLPTFESTETITTPVKINALPFRAIANVWNEYFRDQNLAPEIIYGKDGGPLSQTEISALTYLRKRAWEKDYFTSALPWAQRGPAVDLPANINYRQVGQFLDEDGNNYSGPAQGIETGTTGQMRTDDDQGLTLDNIENLGITINDLRQSARLQEWLERTARGGSRYVEQILSHFGIIGKDSRLMRPEFLGGGKQNVVISEVLNTANQIDPASSEVLTPQGYMAGHGMAIGSQNAFRRRFSEHGYVIGILSALPKTAYFQGIPRTFSRMDKFDYFWPDFAQLGEQEVLNKELYYAQNSGAELEEAFGYQSRYAEYKYNCSKVSGDFRDNLNYWHMARTFSATPTLSKAFVEADPTQRIYNVTDPSLHKFYAQIYNKIDAIRPIPYWHNPKL